MNEGTVVKRMNAGSWNYARARGGALSASVWYQITRKFDTGNPAGLRQRTEGHKFGSWHWNEICPSAVWHAYCISGRGAGLNTHEGPFKDSKMNIESLGERGEWGGQKYPYLAAK